MPFIDIILFALVAAFLVFRLWGALGRRDGHEGGYQDPFQPRNNEDFPGETGPERDEDNVIHLPGAPDDRLEPAAAAQPWDLPEDDVSPLTRGLADIQAADAGFVPSEFLSGSRIAFEMILEAYAAGDVATLKGLLSPDVFGNFQRAIRDREAAGETLEETLVGIKSADIVEAWLENKVAYVTVKIVSEQISATRDENGDIVDGDPEKIMELTDFWTFSRAVRARDPNWSLVETRSLD